MKLNEIAKILVRSALRIKENEIVEVILTGEKKYFDVLDEFTISISALGGYPIIRLAAPSYRRRYLQEVPEKFIRRTPPHALKWIQDYDRHLNIWADDPDPSFKDVKTSQLNAAREARNPINEKILRKNQSIILMPTEELAEYFNIPADLFVDQLTHALDVDYSLLRSSCKKLASRLRKSSRKEITVITGSHSELTFSITGRPVHMEDGTRNLPAGSVFIAPVETTVNGTVIVPAIRHFDKDIEGLELTFKNGQITRSSAEKHHSIFTKRLKDAYGDKDVFGGFGIGLNPGIEKIIGCQPIDAKKKGAVSITIGSNLIHGGNNSSDLIWSMILPCPTVLLDGRTIIEEGVFSA